MMDELQYISRPSQAQISTDRPAHTNDPRPQPGLPTLPQHLPSAFPVSAAATSLALSPQDLTSREASALRTLTTSNTGVRSGWLPKTQL